MAQRKRTRRQSLQEELEQIDEMNEIKRNQIMSLQFSINCKFRNEKQKLMYKTIMENRITFVRGSAGTGKTLISLFTALKCIKDNNINIDQLVLTKPIVEITSSKGLGALPGDINEKTLSYYTHFYDNLTKLIGNEATKYLKSNEIIKETVLNYLRGSTFGKWDSSGKPIGSFCIFDEAQNCSIVEMKTFISRMGEESKLVIMGDSDQIDLKLNRNEKCGLDDAWDRLQGIEGIGFIEFTEDDIVRDPFLIEIMKRYKAS
jgi:phosphate starvation-inducible protein PhoH and related proteins